MRAATLLCLLASTLAAKPQRIELPDGSGEFEWLSTVSFRLSRSWHANTAARANLLVESTHLKIEIDSNTLKATITGSDGKPIVELDGPVRAPGKILLDRKLAPAERIYGVTGATAEPPFFFTSRGFGQMVRGAAKYLVDAGVTRPDRLRITAQGASTIDQFFFYGPTPKEIFEQRKHASPIPEQLPRRTLDLAKLTCEAIRKMNAESLAGKFYEEDAGPEWTAYLGAYTREVYDRGLPVIRPLLMQFTRDPNAAKLTDITTFGDEILIVPRCAAPFTLPQGLWTNLKTGVEHKGRAPVALTEDVTLFARNGTIVPLCRADVIELHYFPKLGAEFFLYEPAISEYTQIHASQAGDFWRLEIESKVSRSYEWVLHHIGENPQRIRVAVKAGEDHILSLPQ